MSRTEPSAPVTLTRVVEVEATRVRLAAMAARSRDTGDPVRPSEHIVVRVADEAGTHGWGEIAATGGADAGTLWRALVDDYGPALLGYGWQRPTNVTEAFAGLPYVAAVQAGLDMACWDLWSRQHSAPLAHSLGGTRTAITAGTTIGRHASLESLVQEVNRQVGHGFRRVRLRIGPGWDVDPVHAVSRAYPFLVLQVDGGGRYHDCPDHLAALRALDAYDLVLIEQPFAGDLAGQARLGRELRTPLALGSDIDSLAALDEAIASEAARALNLDLARLGGITQARRAHDRAVDAGWQVWCGTRAYTGLGRAAVVALASLPGVSLPSEMPGAGTRYRPERDLVEPPVRAHDGIVPVPLVAPGLGHTVDTDALNTRGVASVTLRR